MPSENEDQAQHNKYLAAYDDRNSKMVHAFGFLSYLVEKLVETRPCQRSKTANMLRIASLLGFYCCVCVGRHKEVTKFQSGRVVTR